MIRFLRFSFSFLPLVIVSHIISPVALADWPQFRGPNSSGIAASQNAPIEFGPGKNQLWKVPLSAGHSSPCIVGDSIFLTTFDAEESSVAVVCLNRADGTSKWQKDIPVKKLEKGHPSFNPASSSPACDGEKVVAYFGSLGLVCFDMNGEQLWNFPMPLAKSFGGNATSPIIAGDKVILYRGNYVDHFLLAIDKHSGKEVWRVKQDEKFSAELACTAVPILSKNKLIVHSARSVQAFDVSNGKQLWMTKCATTATSTPVLAGDEVIVAAWNKMGEPSLRPPFPTYLELLTDNDKNDDQTISRKEFPEIWIFHRPDGAEAPMNGGKVRFERADRDKDGNLTEKEWNQQLAGLQKYRASYQTHGLIAIKLDSEGVVEEDKIRTLETQGIPEVPSPIKDERFVYLIKNGGVLSVVDLKTGKRVSRIRTKGRGTHYASPFISGKNLFTVAGDGTISVLSLGPKPKILATNVIGEDVYASPAVVDGTIYVRTHSSLFAFRQ